MNILPTEYNVICEIWWYIFLTLSTRGSEDVIGFEYSFASTEKRIPVFRLIN